MTSSRSFGYWPYIALAVLWAYALIRPYMLWDWEYYHDTPLLNFAAVMMHDFGRVPYRDMFETTMPGTFLFHYIIVGLGLETQTAFVTLGLLAKFTLAGAGTWMLLRIDRMAALLFAPFYLMVMLQFGATALFQREILGLLAIAAALISATHTTLGQYMTRQALVGLFFGMACTIKPQFAAGAPVAVLCLAALAHDLDRSRSFLKTAFVGIAISVAGFSLPLLAVFVWLWSYDALTPFWFILSEYTPYYIQQTQSHAFTTPQVRAQYLWALWFKFGGFWPLLPGAVILSLLAYLYRGQIARRHLVVMTTFLAFTLIYGLVPVLSGQFWNYHYYPFMFFAIWCACALVGLARFAFISKTVTLTGLTVVALTLLINLDPVENIEWRQNDAKTRVALAKDMEVSLRKWVPEGGSVQPIDWTAGALHAMMRARIPIATQFFYDFHFAHHASSDMNAYLRGAFMDALKADPPEVVLIAHSRMKVHGLDVSYDFPQLEAFQAEGYIRVEENPLYDIYLRRDLAS